MGKGGKLSLGNNGGIAGSGIFGFLGTTIHCDAKDNSLYCSTMKFMNLFFMTCLFLAVIYYIYSFLIAKKYRK